MIKYDFERKSIGENVRRFRLEAKMTQKDLAEAMGYKSPSTIAKIESGENSVDLDTCKRLAEILNVSPVMLSGCKTICRQKNQRLRPLIHKRFQFLAYRDSYPECHRFESYLSHCPEPKEIKGFRVFLCLGGDGQNRTKKVKKDV